jgi:hypothetical protein
MTFFNLAYDKNASFPRIFYVEIHQRHSTKVTSSQNITATLLKMVHVVS